MLVDEVAEVLTAAPGLTSSEVAERIGRPSERDVSFALFSAHGRFRCGRGHPARWWLAGEPSRGARPARAGPVATDVAPSALRLYPWQAEALRSWERAGRRGVIEAVTGTGKTMVGVAAACAELRRRGQVLVLVPTIELAHQWVAELATRVPDRVRVGQLGAGWTDDLASHDVVVAVVNSARARDVRPIRAGGLLVADECHRYGSAVNHLALDERFPRRLGLSATYARDDDGNLEWLDPYFGGTCLRVGYARALTEGVTARFEVVLLGVAFAADEQACYDELSELAGHLLARLVQRHGVPPEPFAELIRATTALADGDGDGAQAARAYLRAVRERRRLLADTPAKDEAILGLSPSIGDADRTIVFTQSIAAARRAAHLLAERGLRAGAVHSQLGRDERRAILARFAAGDLDVVAAPRVLDEGIDVPAADLAVIAGASHSRRQMIQRMGRVLRRKADGRRARFAVLFVEGTVEDPAFRAHEAFLDEILPVADRVSRWPARAGVDDVVREALRPRL